jgi:hypothetical protein
MIAVNPEQVVSTAKQLLADSTGEVASKLAVADQPVREGEWVHVIVYPTAQGVAALEYLDHIERIEDELRNRFGKQILVVPTKP